MLLKSHEIQIWGKLEQLFAKHAVIKFKIMCISSFSGGVLSMITVDEEWLSEEVKITHVYILKWEISKEFSRIIVWWDHDCDYSNFSPNEVWCLEVFWISMFLLPILCQTCAFSGEVADEVTYILLHSYLIFKDTSCLLYIHVYNKYTMWVGLPVAGQEFP